MKILIANNSFLLEKGAETVFFQERLRLELEFRR